MLKNSIFQVIGNVLSVFLNLLIIVFTARTLGAAGRGEITYLIICVGILQIFTSVVGNSVMIFMLTKHNRQNVLLASLIWTVLTVICAVPFLYYFSSFSPFSIVVFLLLGLLQTSFTNLITFYSSVLKFKSITFLKAVQPTLFLCLFFIFYLNQNINVHIYWILLIVSFFPHFLLFLFETSKKVTSVTIDSLKLTVVDFLKLGGLGQFTNLMQFASYRFAVLIIAANLGMESTGVFGLWLSVTDAIWVVPIGLATVNMSYAAKNNYNLANLNRYILISVGLSFLLVLVILVMPNSFYVMMLGKDFVALKALIAFSSPVVVLFTINILIAYYFSAKGLIKYNTISSALGLIAILVSVHYLTSNFGLKGAILANCISYTISIAATVFLFIRFRRQLEKQTVINSKA